MIRGLLQILEKLERDWRNSFGHDIVDPKERRRSQWHLNWLDHGVLRKKWHNFEEFAPGAFRSNHPDHKRFADYAARGIKTVLNLRGVAKQPHHLFEVESCAALGLTLVNVQMAARRAPNVTELKKLLHAFETMDRPFLMHCKSGADRTGLAAAIYLMMYHDAALDEARKQLSFRYIHIRKTETGILDHFLDVYAVRNAQAPIAIDTWIRTEYDPAALTASFAEMRRSQWFWQGWR
ncbi:tyrosine-protein phosphatase [Yoonia sp. SS1-5]|uniref:Tyrosine-protein phosphatase n=1 Tax=Yoonia rhodophyticola TaxID=3137370 RepID=A0AAN0NLN6_9RHOB